MPRRGRSSSPAPSRPAPRPAPARNLPAPVQQAPPPAMMAPQQQGPGLMGQMAATAGGVAIGSAVGHTIGHAMTGMFSGGGGSEEAQPAAPAQQQQQQPYSQYQQQPQLSGNCSREIQEFLNCAQTQTDLSLCEGFKHVMSQCKVSNGMM